MKQPWLIDGNKLIEWLNERPTTNAPYYDGWRKCMDDFANDLHDGRFNVKEPERRKCMACNGTGVYDSHGSPPCGACDGTGFEL